MLFADHAQLSASSCLPVQSFHNSTANFTVHTSVTFLINGDERPLLMGCFLKCLETSPFHWRRFCRCVINRLGHAFPQTRNIFTNGTLIPKIYTACSFADAMFSLWNFRKTFFASCLSRTRRALPKANLHISIFHACAMCPKVALVSSSTKTSATLGENRKGCVCLLLLFHEWQNLELLRGYPYFRNALLISMIFRNKYGRAVTVGIYALSHALPALAHQDHPSTSVQTWTTRPWFHIQVNTAKQCAAVLHEVKNT